MIDKFYIERGENMDDNKLKSFQLELGSNRNSTGVRPTIPTKLDVNKIKFEGTLIHPWHLSGALGRKSQETV